MIPIEDLGAFLVETADTLAEGFEAAKFLQSLAANVALVSDAEAVGVMLSGRGNHLSHHASSNQDGKFLELLQLALGEGPSLDCFAASTTVTHTDMGSPDVPWASFAPPAVEAGFRSVQVFPMTLRGHTAGTVSIYSRNATAFGDVETVLTRTMVDVATIRLLQERETTRVNDHTDQLQAALTSRIVIEQAKGAVAAVNGLDVERSFDLLRTRARRHGLRLADLAAAVVADPTSVVDWSSSN